MAGRPPEPNTGVSSPLPKCLLLAGIRCRGRPTGEFLFRETGIMIEVPEIWGHLFIGRTKEGFSLNKVMTGYAGWTMERATIGDATIPILADGVKWLGYAPKLGLLWNLGVYGDWLSKGQSFSRWRASASLAPGTLPRPILRRHR